MESGRFDPRFDPAFQPGYTAEDGAAPASTNAPAAARASTARAAAPVNGAVPVVLTPTNSGTASSIGIKPIGEAETSSATETSSTGETASAPVTTVPRRTNPRRTNPFIIALAVISVALIGGGFYIIARLQENFAATQTNGNLDYVFLQVLAIGAPVVICLGLATGISVIVVSAIGWDRRRG